jgi:hypothetical protein
MYPTLNEQRSHVLRNAKKWSLDATQEAARRVERVQASAAEDLKRINERAENYIRRGYDLIEPSTPEHDFGEFRTGTAFVKALAKDMKRGYVRVEMRPLIQYTVGAGARRHHHATITCPLARKYAPLYASFLLLKCDDDAPYATRYDYNTITRMKLSTVVRFCLTGTDTEHHPLALHWIQNAEVDPDWRKILVG